MSSLMTIWNSPRFPCTSHYPRILLLTVDLILGTTGLPKGVLREAGGHAVGLNLSIKYLFGITPGDVIFTASDIGWVRLITSVISLGH